jgi:hypothetical protein
MRRQIKTIVTGILEFCAISLIFAMLLTVWAVFDPPQQSDIAALYCNHDYEDCF